MNIVDPHIYEYLTEVLGNCGLCTDLTDFGFIDAGLNTRIANYEMNFMLIMRPLDLGAARTDSSFYSQAVCEDANDDAVAECAPGEKPPQVASVRNHVGDGGTCDITEPDSTNAGYDAPRSPTDPCFASDSVRELEMAFKLAQQDGSELEVCTLRLVDGRVAGTYDHDASPNRIEGTMRAFLTDTAAQACVLNNAVLCPDSKSMYDILSEEADACGDELDRDVRGQAEGWWFYINFVAERAEWSAP